MPVRLSVGDPVLVHINKDTDSFGIGLVKYIGFLGGDGLTEYVGLEMMEQCANGHDGTIDGFQYFSAKTKHGLHVGLSHIIRKLSGSEIMLKMQEVVALFKEKLDQYITAVSQRDEYIESLKKSHREAKKLLKSANEKISYLKGELHKQRSASPSLSKSKSNVSVLSNTSSHQSHGSSGNSNSTTNLSNIADIIALESVEHDIDQLMGGMGGADGKSRRRSRRHSRNLSEQIKLDTIDDALPDLSTPAADVPVLMEQLVHSMDGGRRQSFSLGQAVSPRINTNGTNRGNSPSPVSSKGSSSPRSPITTTRGYSHKKTKKRLHRRSHTDSILSPSPSVQETLADSVDLLSPQSVQSPADYKNTVSNQSVQSTSSSATNTTATTATGTLFSPNSAATPSTTGTLFSPNSATTELTEDEYDHENAQLDSADDTPFYSSSDEDDCRTVIEHEQPEDREDDREDNNHLNHHHNIHNIHTIQKHGGDRGDVSFNNRRRVHYNTPPVRTRSNHKIRTKPSNMRRSKTIGAYSGIERNEETDSRSRYQRDYKKKDELRGKHRNHRNHRNHRDRKHRGNRSDHQRIQRRRVRHHQSVGTQPQDRVLPQSSHTRPVTSGMHQTHHQPMMYNVHQSGVGAHGSQLPPKTVPKYYAVPVPQLDNWMQQHQHQGPGHQRPQGPGPQGIKRQTSGLRVQSVPVHTHSMDQRNPYLDTQYVPQYQQMHYMTTPHGHRVYHSDTGINYISGSASPQPPKRVVHGGSRSVNDLKKTGSAFAFPVQSGGANGNNVNVRAAHRHGHGHGHQY